MRKPVTRCLAVVALLCLGMTTQAEAGSRAIRLASAKSCDCVPTSQPDCCRPTIVKPCCPNVYTYQRQISCLKPPCCDGCGAPKRHCRPRHGRHCCNAGCGNTGCCDANGDGCCTDGACGDGTCDGLNGCCPNGCCSSNTPNCEAIRLNNLGNGLCCPGDGGCCPSGACGNGCDADGCCDDCCPCYLSPNECCRLAELIYKSQTACYPGERKSAVRKISNKYDCDCTPEVMAALIYALNDCDPRVRQVAADEINDQLRKHCCCSPELTQALTCALGDCAKPVRKSAERALVKCGYDVVDPCCDTDCCDGSGCDGCGHGFRGKLKGLLGKHGGCGDDCCDADCCDGGCSLGCKFKGIFKKHCGIDCCDGGCDDPNCCDGGCGHKCGIFSKLMKKHHGNGCCDTDCCDGGCGICGGKGFGCKMKGIFAKHHGSDCCDGCDGCGTKKGCGLRGLFSKHRGGNGCCDGCCPTSCCNTGAQTCAPATYAAPQELAPSESAAPVSPDAPAPAPEVAPAPPTEQPAACRPAPKKNLAGLYGQVN